MEREEAIEIARKLYNESLFLKKDKEAMEILIPELKESEGERIRKGLIQYFQKFNLDTFAGIDPKKVLAWLEAQGRQEQLYIRFGEIPNDEKSKIYQGEIEVGTENGVSVYPAFETNNGDIILGLNLPITKTTLHTQQHLLEYDDRPCYLVKGNYVGKDTDGQPLIDNVSIIKKIGGYRVKEERIDNKNYVKSAEKQGEQKQDPCKNCKNVRLNCHNFPCIKKRAFEQGKSALEVINEETIDKVEPKFKVGDWVVSDDKDVHDDYRVCKITKIVDGRYYIEGGDFLSESTLEQYEYRLWTIQDAKEGDVLVNGSNIFIFHFLNDTRLMGYCHVNTDDGQFTNDIGKNECFCLIDAVVNPATKEQRDLLFKKMKDAGYEWDAEHKQLNKIEQNFAESINDTYPETLDKAIDLYYYSYGNGNGYFENLSFEKFKGIIKTFVSDYSKQNPAWSEEDEHKLNYVITQLKAASNIIVDDEIDDSIAFVKSLKDRVQLQNIAYYNPYKEVVESIAEMCEKYKLPTSNLSDFLDNVKVKCKEAKEYDSLYPQTTWKPSDEQITCLHDAVARYNREGFSVATLTSLLEQLKKLREE